MGITAIVNLTPDDFGGADAGFKVHQVRIDDAAELDPAHVGAFLSQMDLWELSGESILIHCHAGISRTASFAIAWLMHAYGANAETDLQALWSTCERRVGRVRPIIMPHHKLKTGVLRYFSEQPSPGAVP